MASESQCSFQPSITCLAEDWDNQYINVKENESPFHNQKSISSLFPGHSCPGRHAGSRIKKWTRLCVVGITDGSSPSYGDGSYGLTGRKPLTGTVCCH